MRCTAVSVGLAELGFIRFRGSRFWWVRQRIICVRSSPSPVTIEVTSFWFCVYNGHPLRKPTLHTTSHQALRSVLPDTEEMSDEDLAVLFMKIDANGSGEVDWDEFTGFLLQANKTYTSRQLSYDTTILIQLHAVVLYTRQNQRLWLPLFGGDIMPRCAARVERIARRFAK